MTPQERDLGSVPREDTEVRKPDFRAWRLCFSNSIPCAWPPPAEVGGSGFEIDTAAPQPAGGPIADLQESGFSVSLPIPAPLSQEPGSVTQEAGEFFPRQGEFDSNPGVYIMNHPKQEISESEWGGGGGGGHWSQLHET